jgi:hypothetical protein
VKGYESLDAKVRDALTGTRIDLPSRVICCHACEAVYAHTSYAELLRSNNGLCVTCGASLHERATDAVSPHGFGARWGWIALAALAVGAVYVSQKKQEPRSSYPIPAEVRPASRAAATVEARSPGLASSGSSSRSTDVEQANGRVPVDESASKRRSAASEQAAARLPKGTASTLPQHSPTGRDNDVLASHERQSIESACGFDRRVNGPGAYNRCVSTKLKELSRAPIPDTTALSPAERESIESACGFDRRVNGPGAYNRCVAMQLRVQGKPN